MVFIFQDLFDAKFRYQVVLFLLVLLTNADKNPELIARITLMNKHSFSFQITSELHPGRVPS